MLPTELCPHALVPICCPWDKTSPESAVVPGAGLVTTSKHAHRNGNLTMPLDQVFPHLLVLCICVSPPLTPPPTPPWFKGGNFYDVAEVKLAQRQWLLRAAICPICPFNKAQPPSAPAGSVHQGVPEQPGLRLRMAVISASLKARQILRASSSEVSSSRKAHAWHLCSMPGTCAAQSMLRMA